MPSSNHRFLSQLGNAIVEFAIIAPMLILLTLGTIELGRYAFFAILVSNAAQAGAAYGSQTSGTAFDAPGIEAAIAQDVSPNPIATITANPAPAVEYGCWDTSNAKLNTPFPATTPCTSGTPVAYVKVSTKGTLKPLFHLPFVNKNGITISKTVVRRVQCVIGASVICQTPFP